MFARKTTVLFGTILAGLIGLAFIPAAMSSSRAALSPQDTAFVREAAMGGMAEVELGRVAVRQASNPDVKAFGQRMIDDHSAADNELNHLASGKGISLPTTIAAKERAEVDRLSKLSGPAFDRQYMEMMVTDHKQDVALFEREATRAHDPDLKSWVTKTLPTLKAHLELSIADLNKLRGK